MADEEIVEEEDDESGDEYTDTFDDSDPTQIVDYVYYINEPVSVYTVVDNSSS